MTLFASAYERGALAAAERALEIETDILLAYYSQAYRLVVVGMAGDAVDDAFRYDGDRSLLEALGGRLFPEPADVVLHDSTRVATTAHGLARLLPSARAVGDVRPLYDYWDDFYDPRAPLDDMCQDSLTVLGDVYALAAQRHEGMKILT